MKNLKIAAGTLLSFSLIVCLCACNNKLISPANTGNPTPAASSGQNTNSSEASFTGIDDTLSDFDKTSSLEATTTIKLSGDTAEINGAGASWAAGKLTISSEGTYLISGNLENGSIHVNAEKKSKVRLILNGVNISNSRGPAIFIESADKTVITLADGSSNILSDGKSYTEGNACIYSKDDLTINGSGYLKVTGNCNNGIGSKNDLKIASGSLEIEAVANGLKGNDSVSVFDGTITIKAGKDGIKADTADTENKGFVYICGGTISINATDDGIQAETSLGIVGGKLSIVSGDKRLNCKTYCYEK